MVISKNLSSVVLSSEQYFDTEILLIAELFFLSYFCHLPSTNYFELQLSYFYYDHLRQVKMASSICIRKNAELLIENNICIITCVLQLAANFLFMKIV